MKWSRSFYFRQHGTLFVISYVQEERYQRSNVLVRLIRTLIILSYFESMYF